MIDLRLGSFVDVLADSRWDACVVDAPYGARVHEGHDDGCVVPERDSMAKGGRTRGDSERRRIDYVHWTPKDVDTFVDFVAPRTDGWIVSITSHDLAPAWATALEAAGRYVFAPLPWYSPGSRVRLSGDGPSSWTCWIIVARPKTREFQRWGTLPGGYVTKPEHCEVVGGKPLSLMRALVRDYTRPGDLVCDPCAGSGTTAVAARDEGRRFIGAECDQKHHAIAMARLARGHTPDLFTTP